MIQKRGNLAGARDKEEDPHGRKGNKILTGLDRDFQLEKGLLMV